MIRLKLIPYVFEGYDVIAFGDPAILSQLEMILQTKKAPRVDNYPQKTRKKVVNKVVNPILNYIGDANKKVEKILRNRAKCRKCGDVIESMNRHDFKFCRCGAIFVDGGKDYLRRGGLPQNIEELSTYGKKKTSRRTSRKNNRE